MDKFNVYEQKRKELKKNELSKKDAQCTFRPKLVTASYGRKFLVKEKEREKGKQIIEAKKAQKQHKFVKKLLPDAYKTKRQNRLISWGQMRDKKHLNKALGPCLREIRDISISVELSKSRALDPHILNLNKSLDTISTTSAVPGANIHLMRQAKAKALKQQKSITFKDDTYSMLF